MNSKVFVAAAMLAAAANAGQLTIKNSCNFDTSISTVHQSDPAQEQPKIAANGGTFTQDLTARGGNSWVAKLSTPYSTGNNITQIEWSANSKLWFDVSLIDGDAFSGAGVAMYPSDKSCPTAICSPGANCVDAYHHPADPKTLVCDNAGSSMLVELCGAESHSPFYAGSTGASDAAQGAAQHASSAHAMQAPAATSAVVQAAAFTPASTPAAQQAAPQQAAPQQAAPQQHGNGVHVADDGHVWVYKDVVYTSFVTKVVRAAAPTAVAEKREAHEHGHAHAHDAAHQNA